MLNNSGIYLTRPNSTIRKPLDLDKRRVHKVAKVNKDFIKFGKSERPLEHRYKEYKKIFGDDVTFEPIVIINDTDKLVAFENFISQLFENYKITNPGSTRKLEWITGISFDYAKEKILDAYKKFNN